MNSGFLIYFLALVGAALCLPPVYFDPATHQFLFLLGFLSLWRYGWSLTHVSRSLIYRKRVFPRLRAREQSLGQQADPEHVFLLLTTFRIGTEVTVEVYRAAIQEAIRNGLPTTIVASIVELSEERLITTLFRNQQPPDRVRLKIVRIAGTGKRDALAAGFRAIANTPVDKTRSVVAVIDGDSILSAGCLEACYRLFALEPKLGALTTDEEGRLEGRDRVTGIYRRWYSLRFAQRHIYMSSLGLSRRVLTLTGRMSMFRASIVTAPDFIRTVQADYIDHWRLGRFQFLTGDDKSSWFHLLKDGWEMWYVPDVTVITIEEPPHPNFFVGATALMRRWFGNMLRSNTRALTVPRKTMGFFTWWCLIDQRISIWTSLFGTSAGILGGLKYGPSVWLVSLWWIAFIRYLQTLMLRTSRPRLSITWPFFIYFNQIYGSLIKVYVLNHLYKQKWTRQKTTLKAGKDVWEQRYREQISNLTLTAAFLTFLLTVAVMIGLLTPDDFQRAILLVQSHSPLISWRQS